MNVKLIVIIYNEFSYIMKASVDIYTNVEQSRLTSKIIVQHAVN
jgi:hypothetical protein